MDLAPSDGPERRMIHEDYGWSALPMFRAYFQPWSRRNEALVEIVHEFITSQTSSSSSDLKSWTLSPLRHTFAMNEFTQELQKYHSSMRSRLIVTHQFSADRTQSW